MGRSGRKYCLLATASTLYSGADPITGNIVATCSRMSHRCISRKLRNPTHGEPQQREIAPHEQCARRLIFHERGGGGRRNAVGEYLSGRIVRSAASDWSRFPLGTRFKIVETDEEYVIDDYGTALVGTNTIDLYKPIRLEMKRWGVRHVDIDILQWGSEEQSLKVLSRGRSIPPRAGCRSPCEKKKSSQLRGSRTLILPARMAESAPRMKILVVGGAGYIGSICAEVLLDERHDVAIFDNLSEGHRHAVDPRARIYRGRSGRSRGDRPTLWRELRPDAVMHFAANALVGESMQNPSKYFRNNIANGLNLLDAMIAAEVRSLVFSSTCATFGPPERCRSMKTLPQRPINPYGESKLAFEKILRWYDEIHGLRFVVASLLQRRRRVGKIRRRSPLRDASDSERSQSRARPKTARRNFRHRLRDAGWHLHSRLHSHSRSGPGAHPRARAPSRALFTILALAAARACAK